jgi:4-hydroxythreonine-4-phosphate dehydrogenase
MENAEWVETDGSQADLERLRPGRADGPAGRLQLSSLQSALDAVLSGDADALCTGPITKAAIQQAGFVFPGHTEYLAHRTETKRFAMMLAGPGLRVVPLTGHVPLSEVRRTLTPELVTDGLVVTATSLFSDFGVERPRLALAALNPHAGEQGVLGDEEQEILAPGRDVALDELRRRGIAAKIHGPISSDALFVPPIPYDAVVCCYHDQALIPLKMVSRDAAVNVTLGLPIVRTSPAHGTAPDIAWQGRANPGSMRAALELAAELVRRRRLTRPAAEVL